ncbi:MAG TPA: penicillin acylase family protein, partial [Thermoanaerobaculia bacterium]|nr:penicillin acylase family protein [Thermoanaerobaculia bacterium]
MSFPGTITRNAQGIARVDAFTRNDAYFLQGYLHARDRLFQMDFTRRSVLGTLAELVGDGGLANDVQARGLNLERAANASLQAMSPRARAALDAYAAGVNAGIASQALPPEYAALELSKVEPWTPLHSVIVAKGIAFGLSFDLGDIDRTVALLTYQGVGKALGFDGTKLFFEDLYRSAPFTSASTVPDAKAASGLPNVAVGEAMEAVASPLAMAEIESASAALRPETLAAARQWVEDLRKSPFFGPILEDRFSYGSNMWGVRPSHSASGKALMANDPHLALDTPSTFYPITLRAGDLAVTGMGFAGVPFVIHGRNLHIAWGSTVNPTDVTDVYQETVVQDAASPIGFSTLRGTTKQIIFPYLQTFRKNNVGNGTKDDLTVVPPSATIPQATLVVPARNAAIVSFSPATGSAVSVQYTGLYATREIEAFMAFNEAKNLDDFRNGLQYFDFGAQNWSYQDVEGNIAYFTSGEVPIREDLQAGTVTGLPPYFIRNGTGGNDWVRNVSPGPTQSTLADILPFNEMPQLVNPPWFVNANNDPAGTTLDNDPLNQLRPGGGIYYLSPGYDGFRGGRATQMMKANLASGRKANFGDMIKMQGDVVMIDAQYFVPIITAALANAKASGANPALAQLGAHPAVTVAAGRLAQWDFSAPTGIQEGYDFADVNGQRSAPSQAEIDASVAATIYSVWRGQILKNTIYGVLAAFPAGTPVPPGDLGLTALKNLFDNFATRGGRGASGVNFFNVTGVDDAAARRDIIVLKSLADSIALLASNDFKAAFNNSTNMDDYRWGKLH